MIETSLTTLRKFKNISTELIGYNKILAILLMGIFFHPSYQGSSNYYENTLKNKKKELQEINEMILDNPKLEQNIIIIAGSIDDSVEQYANLYRENLIEAFRDYKGIIISNGIREGVGKIVGDIQEIYPDTIKTIGYLPFNSDKKDNRYSILNETKEEDFSILEVLQYWYDIVKSDVDSSKIKLIVFNGGEISSIEYRMAITFGAQVGIVKKSGGAADDLIIDEWWMENKDVQSPKAFYKLLENDATDLYYFITLPYIREGLSIFISYSSLDVDYFQIQKVRDVLLKYPSIGEILMYEENSSQNIVKYMNETLERCNVLILFCSENAKKSKSVEAEWSAAFQMQQEGLLKIIPVYEKKEYIPKLLWSLLNVKYSKENLEDFVKKLYIEILRE